MEWAASRPDWLRSSSGKLAETDPRGRRIQRSVERGVRQWRRCGRSRIRGGLIENEANKGARVPLLDMHEVDIIYQKRERLEPLVLSQSIPHLSPGDLHSLEQIQDTIETNSDVTAFLQLDRDFHLLTYGLSFRPADVEGHPAVELHPALPQDLCVGQWTWPDVGNQL